MAFIPAIGSAILGGTAAAAVGTVGTAIVGGLAVGGAVVGVSNTVKSINAAKASAGAAQAAAQTQVKLQQAQASAARRSAIRRNIVARSRMRAQAAAAGAGTSSAFFGGSSSLSSQLGTNLGQSSFFSGLGARYTSLTGEAAYQSSRSAMFGSIASLGFGVMRNAGTLGSYAMGAQDAYLDSVYGPMQGPQLPPYAQ